MGVWESQMRERYDEYLSLFMRLTQKMIKYKNITNFFLFIAPFVHISCRPFQKREFISNSPNI